MVSGLIPVIKPCSSIQTLLIKFTSGKNKSQFYFPDLLNYRQVPVNDQINLFILIEYCL
jgi:hypothetical protein